LYFDHSKIVTGIKVDAGRIRQNKGVIATVLLLTKITTHRHSILSHVDRASKIIFYHSSAPKSNDEQCPGKYGRDRARSDLAHNKFAETYKLGS